MAIAGFAACLMATSAYGQTSEPPAKKLDVELNALQQSEAGCKVTFLARNAIGADLEKVTLEIALFNKTGAIDQLVTLDFKGLTQGKTKVLQFQLPGFACDGVGRVLINDLPACQGDGVTPDMCLAALETKTNLDITFGL